MIQIINEDSVCYKGLLIQYHKRRHLASADYRYQFLASQESQIVTLLFWRHDVVGPYMIHNFVSGFKPEIDND